MDMSDSELSDYYSCDSDFEDCDETSNFSLSRTCSFSSIEQEKPSVSQDLAAALAKIQTLAQESATAAAAVARKQAKRKSNMLALQILAAEYYGHKFEQPVAPIINTEDPFVSITKKYDFVYKKMHTKPQASKNSSFSRFFPNAISIQQAPYSGGKSSTNSKQFVYVSENQYSIEPKSAKKKQFSLDELLGSRRIAI